jgi:hypothetical protein
MSKKRKAKRPTIKDVTRLQLQCADLSEKLAAAEDRERRATRGMDMAEADKAMFAKEGSAEVRVLRIIEYRGPQRWVEETVRKSIHGTRQIDREKSITAVTLHEYPEQIRVARHATNIPTGSDAPAPVTDYAKGIPDTLANREPFRG